MSDQGASSAGVIDLVESAIVQDQDLAPAPPPTNVADPQKYDPFAPSFVDMARRRFREDAAASKAAKKSGNNTGSGTSPPEAATEEISSVLLPKEEGRRIANALIKNTGGESHFLMPYKEWQDARAGGLRSSGTTSNLDDFHLICPVNTLEHTNVVVCSYALTGGCPLNKAVFMFTPGKRGTDSYLKHSKGYGSKAKSVVSKLPNSTKAAIAVGTDHAAVSDHLPFNFAGQKEMLSYGAALFKAGQMSAMSETYDIADTTPSAPTVTRAVQSLADKARR